MKFTLELFKKFKVKYSWFTLLVGRKLGLVNYNSVISFTEELVNKNPELNDLNVIELLWAKNEERIDQILERIVIDNGETFDFSTESRRWIFCVLSSFKESIKSDEELLEKIAEVYSGRDSQRLPESGTDRGSGLERPGTGHIEKLKINSKLRPAYQIYKMRAVIFSHANS